MSSPFDENRMHQLGSFADVSSRMNCRLCAFINEAFLNGPVLSSTLAGARVQGCWTKVLDGLPIACLTIWLMPQNERNGIPFNIRLISKGASPTAGAGRIICDPKINPSMVRTWIDTCQTNHGCEKATSRNRPLPAGFMLIHVDDMCLVETSTQDRYIALSYVWGNSVKFKTISSNVNKLKQGNAFHKVWDQLNPTIRDAILFARRLGEQYIWVDSLCILQDSAENSKANIEAMDSIYQQATLVIVAADDRAISEGLHGVSKPRVAFQPQTEIVAMVEVLGVFDHSTHMDCSRYETRGWT
jgi:hypothetical protein